MARTGRPPKPTAQKKLQGTLRKGRENPDEPQLPEGMPMRPLGIDGLAGEFWDFIVPVLVESGIATRADGIALESMCLHYGRAKAADQMVKEQGLTVCTPQGLLCAHPAVGISRGEWAAFNRVAAEFGLNPSARTKLRVSKKPERDEVEEELFGKPLRAIEGGKA